MRKNDHERFNGRLLYEIFLQAVGRHYHSTLALLYLKKLVPMKQCQ